MLNGLQFLLTTIKQRLAGNKSAWFAYSPLLAFSYQLGLKSTIMQQTKRNGNLHGLAVVVTLAVVVECFDVVVPLVGLVVVGDADFVVVGDIFVVVGDIFVVVGEVVVVVGEVVVVVGEVVDLAVDLVAAVVVSVVDLVAAVVVSEGLYVVEAPAQTNAKQPTKWNLLVLM